MKKLSILIALSLLITLVSCAQKEPNDVVLTSDKTVYSADAKTITVDWQNNLNEEIMVGNPFRLEKKDGEWKKVEPKTDATFTMPAYLLQPGKSKGHTYSIDFYGGLKTGEYRLCATYMIYSDEQHIEHPIYFYFEVE